MSPTAGSADVPDMSPSEFRREDAQTMAEYAVVLGVITPTLLLALWALSDAVIPIIERVTGYF